MMKNTLEDYKTAIKWKYEIEKTGSSSSYLFHPSRARLRKLCAELFLHNTSPDDLKSFSAFFQFDFTPNCSNKLKEQTDKFRPIETFFKGETDLTDTTAVNIAAILVDFQPRPFLKFSKQETFKIEPPISSSSIESTNQPIFVEETGTAKMEEGFNGMHHLHRQAPLQTKKEGFLKKRLLLPMVLLATTLFGFGYFFTPKKACMQWQNDRYVEVTCEAKAIGLVDIYSIIPTKEELLHFRKIQVCDTTTFFRQNKPVVWYSKVNKQLEYFNGPGFNPENGKALKPITQYMINTHIKSAPK
ncbi:hypothetical protein [Flavobacterium sp. SM2513]|uniref:hypothetical protein n=1 Tax=Flavobacterium sp. SM2513 TaxID=3424766 RepID=UPI003D7F1B6A